VEKHGRNRQSSDSNIILGTHIECWITKATDTHSEYAILTAYPTAKWLSERASVLRLYVCCLVHGKASMLFVTFKANNSPRLPEPCYYKIYSQLRIIRLQQVQRYLYVPQGLTFKNSTHS